MTSQIYIAVAIVVLAVIALLMVFVRRSGKEKRFTPLAGLAFGFILAGLFFGEKRLIGYGLLGVGVLLAVIDMFKKSKNT
jgi:hypothetical protein